MSSHSSPPASAPLKIGRQGVLLRAVLILIALHIVWTIGCAWVQVHSNNGNNSSIQQHRSALRARAEWLLKYEERQDEEGDAEEAGRAGRVAVNNEIEEKQLAWSLDPENARSVQSALLQTTGRKSLPLRAYAEPPLSPQPPKSAASSANSTISRKPRLSVRTHSPDDLTMYEYSAIQICSDIPKRMPTGHPSSEDGTFGTNTFNKQPLYPLRHEYAQHHCPIDADPFLPWVHDVFPSIDGRYIEFVAHNKRRCNTDPKIFWDDIVNLEAQVAIMQPVPVKRLEGGDDEAKRLQPSMWLPSEIEDSKRRQGEGSSYRFRLASHQEADQDATETRFICRFHTLRVSGANEKSSAPQLDDIILGETLSVAPYNYELLNYRKPGSQPMLTRPESPTAKGGSGAAPHNSAVWNAMHHFRCPVPDNLVDVIKSGSSIVNDIPSIYVDVVPLRTYPRNTREGYIKGVKPDKVENRFDPDLEWGSNNVLPRVEASGRWANFPICRPPIAEAKSKFTEHALDGGAGDPGMKTREEKDYLIGCTWASAAYTTRGDGNLDTTTSQRMLEWLTYNFEIAGFDHIYVYDNTGAHTDKTSLAPITDLFPGRVTRIEWPHRICNNNRPAHSNTGERSSQHAAEASCRIRFGSSAQWLANLDSDEYLVPNGKWNSISDWLRELADKEKQTHILSYFQTRAKPIAELMVPYQDGRECKGPESVDLSSHPICVEKNSSLTYLETYSCEPTTLPKPADWAWRAKKQIYRPWYVLNHFVHYAMATTRINEHPGDVSPRFKATSPYERRVDELHEGFMLHTKSTPPHHTAKWYEKCRASADKCPVGVPWPPDGKQFVSKLGGEAKLKPNCYRNERVTNDIAPRLRDAMKKKRNFN